MKHPNQSLLATHAGGDLGPLARWRVTRHLGRCERCNAEVAGFEAAREIATELAETPEIAWNRLAAEMKANIRLGLAAGECVRVADGPFREARWFTGARSAVALASMAILLVTGVVLESPQPWVARSAARSAARNIAAPPKSGAVVEATAAGNGIQVSEDGQALGLLHSGAGDVLYSASAQGNMGASYVDDKGYVTVNTVYVQ